MMSFILRICLIIFCIVLAGCPTSPKEDEKIILTYTEVQGRETPEIIQSLKLAEKLRGVEIRPLPVPAAVLYMEPYVLSLSTGSYAIDAYLLDAPWVKRYSATNWLAPLNVGNTDFDLSAYREELLEVTSIGSGSEKKLLAVPFETKGNILFYRKDLLDQYGFEPPKHWDELFVQCQTVLANNEDERLKYGFVFHGSVFINDFYPIMWGYGGGIYDDDGNLAVNRPENVRALAMVKRMLGTISPTAEDMENEDLFDAYNSVERIFAQGKTIFMINWNIRWGDLAKGLPGQVIDINNIGVAPIPCDHGLRNYSNIGSFGWGINHASRHPDEARKFIQLITSYEAQRWRAVHSGIIPSRWDVLSDPEIREKAPEVLEIANVFRQVELRARPFLREINDNLDEALIGVLRDNLDPLETLEQTQRKIQLELYWMQRNREAIDDER